jgi:hypothetical protein
MRDRIFRATVVGETALLLVTSALATAEQTAAQWRDEYDGGWGGRGPSGEAGAWLDNRRVNLCD